MKQPKLCLHCGASEVERQALEGVVLPPTTKSYTPVGHNVLLDLAEDMLGDVGFRFGNSAHSLTHDGSRYFGLVQLLNGTEYEQHALVMGIRNSLDKRFPAGFSFGAVVFVCDNLSFTGENVIKRKHTPNIMRDLPDMIAEAVSSTKVMRDDQERRFEQYQGFRLTDQQADHVIVNMLRAGVVNTSRVEKVVREWDEPSHDFGGRTAWRLFNATTESLKGLNLHDMPTRTIGLQSLMDDVTGYEPQLIAA